VARFFYTFKTSDGRRRVAEIESGSRDEAFAELRRQGIRPIKVVAEDGSRENGASRPAASAWWGFALAAAIAALVAGAWWIGGGGRDGTRPDGGETVVVASGPSAPIITGVEATPLPRQTVQGDRKRIEDAKRTAFAGAAEAWLAQYAEPGRRAEGGGVVPNVAEFESALKEPVKVTGDDFTEVVDLKRMVEGMKQEMREFLEGGGTMEEYVAEVLQRQKEEASCRERAEAKLESLLANPRDAYDYWLKANAQLKSMGIYELPLPDALQGYQAGLDLNE